MFVFNVTCSYIRLADIRLGENIILEHSFGLFVTPGRLIC